MIKHKLLSALLTVGLMAFSAACIDDATKIKSDKPEIATKPYVEAFIAYPGPSAHWAGPEMFSIHINARNNENVSVSVIPKRFVADVNRIDDFSSRGKVTPTAMRDQLGFLAAVVQKSPDEKWRGCLSPVHVRLVREDGVILEKSACRDNSGWQGETSRVVDRLMASALFETPFVGKPTN